MTPEAPRKLPLWRLIAALAVFGAMASVLIALAPVYLENYRLGQYMHSLVRQPAQPDDTLRGDVLARAHQLNLPVRASDMQISHDAGKVHLQVKYVVQMDFPLYQVDVHLGDSATAP